MTEKLPTPEDILKAAKEWNVDETPVLKNESEARMQYLEEDLDKLSSEELTKTKNWVEDRAQDDNVPEDEFEKYSDVAKAIGYLLKLKTFSNKEAVIDDISQREVKMLASIEGVQLPNDDVEDALFQLSRTVQANAQVKFPQSYKSQVEFRTQKEKAALEEARRNLKNLKIS